MPTSRLRVRTSCPIGSGECKVSNANARPKYATYFWCHELGSTTESASGGAIPHLLLTQTVIGNLDVSVQSKHNVIEFQITVDDAVLVEVLEGEADLGRIKPVSMSASDAVLRL